MANWKALTWSESVRTGKQAARHVLTVLCLKSDDDYRVFSDATRLAGFCELSTRRIYGWLDYLEQHGLVTVIRRVRPNGSEAKPITLLNAPDAPHLNGKPVVLDYGGKYLYPREPAGLRQAGIQWVSAGDLGHVHPSHPDPAQPDDSSGWQGDELAGCSTSADHDHSQVTQHDESSGRQHDDSSPHGDDELSPPNQSPPEAFPSNQPDVSNTSGSAGASNGWLAGPGPQQPPNSSSQPERTDTAGAALLRSLGISGKAFASWAPTVDAALERLGKSHVHRALTHGTHGLKNPAGAIIKTRLPQLQAQLDTSTQTPPATQRSTRCETCDESRMRIAANGTPYRCPSCHPRANQPTTEPDASQQRSSVGTVGSLDELLAS